MANEKKSKATTVWGSGKHLSPNGKVSRASLDAAFLGDLSGGAVELSLDQRVVGGEPAKANEVDAGLLIVAAKKEVARRLGDDEGAGDPDAEGHELEEGGGPPLLSTREVEMNAVHDPVRRNGVSHGSSR